MSNYQITIGGSFSSANAEDLFDEFGQNIDAYGGVISAFYGSSYFSSLLQPGQYLSLYYENSGSLVSTNFLQTAGGVYLNAANNTQPIQLMASSFGSVLIGSAFSDIIYGGPGTDTLTGGGGHDTFSDNYMSYNETGQAALGNLQGDTITDLSTSSQFFLIEFSPLSASYSGGVLTIAGSQATEPYPYQPSPYYAATLTLNTPGFSAQTVTVDGDTLLVDRGAASNSYTTLSTDTTVLGTAEPDVITGGGSDVQILGLGGDDTLTAGPGHDMLYGNQGDDHLIVGASSAGATVYGGKGNDVIDASASTHANLLSGDLGDDSILAGSGADTLFGGDGADTLHAGAGLEQLYGNMGNDLIVVGAASVGATIYGGQGNDVIDASVSTHANYISGDLGNDSILGGAGADTIHGGAGSDTIQAALGSSNQIHVGLADSSALSATDTSQLDHVLNFGANNVLVFDGDPAGTTANTTTHGGDASITDFAAAYTYAYGDATHTAAIAGAVAYAVVSDTAGHVYVFAADHAAVELDGLAGGVSSVTPGQILSA